MPVALGERVVDRILATPGAAKWLPALKSTESSASVPADRSAHKPRTTGAPIPNAVVSNSSSVGDGGTRSTAARSFPAENWNVSRHDSAEMRRELLQKLAVLRTYCS